MWSDVAEPGGEEQILPQGDQRPARHCHWSVLFPHYHQIQETVSPESRDIGLNFGV